MKYAESASYKRNERCQLEDFAIQKYCVAVTPVVKGLEGINISFKPPAPPKGVQ